MSFSMLADVFAYLNSEQSHLDKINSHDYCVLTAISNYMGKDGTPAYPALPHLCKLTRLSRSSLQRSIAKLERLGRLDRQPGAKPHASTRYTLPLDRGSCETPLEARGSCETPPRGIPQLPNPGMSEPEEREKSYAHAPEEGEKRRHFLDWLGCTPNSDVWVASMNGYLQETPVHDVIESLCPATARGDHHACRLLPVCTGQAFVCPDVPVSSPANRTTVTVPGCAPEEDYEEYIRVCFYARAYRQGMSRPAREQLCRDAATVRVQLE